ncbi:general secretion pathway protein GspE [Anaeromyxobacter sp. SG26]|uniref:GspE/PulE/PilB domain-containing protein n=1 Tax=Anaeromyxobacter sp. SG26 TaxID=2925407 RepID=UPI001F58AD66|nr:general secretion pathway protein GspE [Anaeromyxobacter sp. SG26]
MPRLGEILLQDGACDPEAIRGALENQVIFGGRLGTNLLEMGAVTEEALAAALGRRHRLPALSGELPLDPKALALLRADVADRHDVVPYLVADRRLAILACDPSDLAMLDEVAFATGKQVHPIVAPEARIWALLKQGYGIERQLRGIEVEFGSLRRRLTAEVPLEGAAAPVAEAPEDLLGVGEFDALYAGTGAFALAPPSAAAAPAVPADDEEIIELDDLVLPDDAVAPPFAAEVLASLAGAPGHAPPARFVAPAPRRAEPEPSPLGFDEALRSLEGVTERDAIARIVLRHARSRFRRAVLLTVNRGELRGWAGLGEGVDAEQVRRLRLALGAPGVGDTVVRTRAHFLGPLPKTEANIRLLKRLGGGVPGNAFLVPILALGRVVNVFYADNGRGGLVDAGGVGELLILATRIAKSYETLVARVR